MVAAAGSVVDVSAEAPPAPVAVLDAAPVVVACAEPVTAVPEFVALVPVEPVFDAFDVVVLASSASFVSFDGDELAHPSVMRTRTTIRSSLWACMMRTKVLVPVKLFENVAACGSSSIFQFGRVRHLRQSLRSEVVAEA